MIPMLVTMTHHWGSQLSVLSHKVSICEKHLISYSPEKSICASKLLIIKQCITNTNVCKNSLTLTATEFKQFTLLLLISNRSK